MSAWDDDWMDDEEYAYAMEREREAEEAYEARQRARDADFDAALDAYQERQAEAAMEAEARGNVEARRPDAVREQTTFGELRVGDFMTAEDGPDARWVEVVAIDEFKPRAGQQMTVTFRTPQPIGVGEHDRWVLDRKMTDEVVIDATVRAAAVAR